MDSNPPQWVALAVVQSYNPRRKVPRSKISIPDLESCLSKASFSAAQSSGKYLQSKSAVFYVLMFVNLDSDKLNLSYHTLLLDFKASIHMPRIGYQDASDRAEWYSVERLLRKYASIYGIKIYVYVFFRFFPSSSPNIHTYRLSQQTNFLKSLQVLF